MRPERRTSIRRPPCARTPPTAPRYRMAVTTWSRVMGAPRCAHSSENSPADGQPDGAGAGSGGSSQQRGRVRSKSAVGSPRTPHRRNDQVARPGGTASHSLRLCSCRRPVTYPRQCSPTGPGQSAQRRAQSQPAPSRAMNSPHLQPRSPVPRPPSRLCVWPGRHVPGRAASCGLPCRFLHAVCEAKEGRLPRAPDLVAWASGRSTRALPALTEFQGGRGPSGSPSLTPRTRCVHLPRHPVRNVSCCSAKAWTAASDSWVKGAWPSVPARAPAPWGVCCCAGDCLPPVAWATRTARNPIPAGPPPPLAAVQVYPVGH